MNSTEDGRCGHADNLDARRSGCECVWGDRRAGGPRVGRGISTGSDQRAAEQGYTVNIDRIGTAPINQCVVTNVRNPQRVTQWVPYTGPGRDGDNALVLAVIAQSISVTLDCSR